MTSPKTKRTRFTIAKKIEILNLLQNGNARSDVCRQYSIASSTLFQFIKDEKKIRSEFETNRDSNRQMIKDSPRHTLEQALVKWVHVIRERKIAIDGPMVQEQALKFAKEMGITDFTASNGWLDRFKKREKLDFKACLFFFFFHFPFSHLLSLPTSRLGQKFA